MQRGFINALKPLIRRPGTRLRDWLGPNQKRPTPLSGDLTFWHASTRGRLRMWPNAQPARTMLKGSCILRSQWISRAAHLSLEAAPRPMQASIRSSQGSRANFATKQAWPSYLCRPSLCRGCSGRRTALQQCRNKDIEGQTV